MTRTRARLLFGLSLVHLAAAGTFFPACDTAPAVSEMVSRTSTVALARESAVLLVFDVPVEVVGTLSGSNVVVDFEGTVTASSADQAKSAAMAVTITHVSDAETLRVELRTPVGAQALTGLAKVTLPRGVILGVRTGGTAHVRAMDRGIDIEAAGNVLVEDLRDSARVTTNANLLLSSTVPASSTLEATAGGGIELALPPALSAEVELSVPEGAQIVIQHPGLPPPIGGVSSSYRTVVRGGAALVRAVAQGGNITVLPL